MLEKKLYKGRYNKKLDGVCAGIGNYFNIDPTLIRILWVIITIFSAFFGGIIAYIVCALIIPTEPMISNYDYSYYSEDSHDNKE